MNDDVVCGYWIVAQLFCYMLLFIGFCLIGRLKQKHACMLFEILENFQRKTM
jgi:hypothetical protein